MIISISDEEYASIEHAIDLVRDTIYLNESNEKPKLAETFLNLKAIKEKCDNYVIGSNEEESE